MAKPTKTLKELPATPEGLAKEAAKLRAELRQARLDHVLQKLSSPATLRSTRRQLARVLTVQRVQNGLTTKSAVKTPVSAPVNPASATPAKTNSSGDSHG